MSAIEASWIIALTGASGACYGLRLLRILARQIERLHLIVSQPAAQVLRAEEDIEFDPEYPDPAALLGFESAAVICHPVNDIGAEVASGSARVNGMVIVPCTMATLAAVAHGVQSNLIHRAADVMLKEQRRLILVPRETPFSAIHLENMLKLSRSGARIVPAMPGFYHRPRTLSELVDMQVMKILDAMGVSNDLAQRWTGCPPAGVR